MRKYRITWALASFVEVAPCNQQQQNLWGVNPCPTACQWDESGQVMSPYPFPGPHLITELHRAVIRIK